jgi:hypothetical protein
MAEVPGAPELLESLEGFDLGFLERIYLQHWGFRDTSTGLHLELAMAFEGELILALPGLDLLSFVLGANVPGYTFISGTTLIGSRSQLDLYNLQLNLRLTQGLLTPVALNPEATIPEQFEVQVRGSFGIDTELNIQPRLESFTIPPFAVGQTGLILALEACQLDLSSTTSPAEVLALGYEADFRGVYAKSATLHWLPQVTLAGLPGLRLNFADVALGQTGVSFDVEQIWLIEHDQGVFLPGTELKGYLLGEDWELALAKAEGTVRQNFPSRFFVAGLLEVPLLNTIFAVEFGLRPRDDGPYESTLTIFKPDEAPAAQAAIGPGMLTIDRFNLSGTLAEDSFAVTGTFQGALDLPGFELEVGLANVVVSHTETGDEFKLELTGVEFGPLGEVETANLHYKSVVNSQTGERDFSLLLATTLSWEDLHARLNLDDLPAEFPLPPDDAEITAYLSWETAPSTRVILRFSAEVSDLDSLWRFVPTVYRPEVRDFKFAFAAKYDDAVEFQNGTTDSSFQGEISAEMSVRLPALPAGPGVELFIINTGDADGWIEAKLVAGTRPNAQTGAQEPYMDLELANPVSIDVNFPGLPQPQPPIHTAITRVALDIAAATDIEGSFTLAGDFALRPVEPPASLPMAAHLSQLLAPISLSDLVGTATFTLRFKNDTAAMSLDCTFVNAEIELDVFDMIANLSRGFGPPDGEAATTEIPLDLDVGFGLRGIKLQLGTLETAAEASQFSLEMVIGVSLPGVSAELFFLLSDQEFVLGLSEALEIPLHIPQFPLSPDDLNELRGAGGSWTVTQWQDRLSDLETQIANYGDVDDDPVARQARAKLQAQEFLLQNMLGIFQAVGEPNRPTYQTYIETVVGVFYATTSALHVESDIKLVLSGRHQADGSVNPNGVRFVIPFGDPRNIALQGAASLAGFAADDPFKVLEGFQLGLGLSSDMIFFSLDSLGTPIEIPEIGRYSGGSINLSRLRIGYGYTKNSFSLNFAGAVVLPEQLVEDAETSDLIGAGVRLPTHNALSFKLDLIPVVLGPVDFVVPLFEFDLDLRQPTSQALVSSQVCQPYWDGLQIIVPNLYHDALKHVAFSPMFSLSVIPNFRFDGDLMIGDEDNGLTIIADNVLVLIGYYSGGVPLPIPFFASLFEPYFDNLCLNVRLAGFGLNFNLQRPFPSLSPLALFEVLGLLSDPTMRIDPAGSLANTIRISLTDAYLTLPPDVIGIFPELAGVINKPLNLTLNLGTLITVVQAVVGTAGEIAEIVEDYSRDLDTRLRQLANNPPEFSLSTLLAAIPPELRKYRLGASLAGFEASAVLLLIDAGDVEALRQEFRRRYQRTGTPVTPALALDALPDPEELARFRPNLARRPGSGRTYYPDDPGNSLFKGLEFDAFTEHDFDDVPLPARSKRDRSPTAGVVVAAHVKLFTGQRFRFLGYLFADGTFSLITAVDLPPLTLPVAGISITFPFEARGRLLLSGRQKRDGSSGLISAAGYGRWQVVPGLARLEVASKKNPARLELYSNGQFRVAGDVLVSLFDEAVSLIGRVDISHTHCFVSGRLRYQVGQIIDLLLTVEGRFGPGPRFLIAGGGSLKILGHELTSVKGIITEQSATFEARLSTGQWQVAGVELACDLQLALSGTINLRRKLQPEFLLEGAGSLAVLGASVRGRGGIRRRKQKLTTYVEGALTWQGREWLGGRLELGSAGVRLSGRTSFSLNLTPSNLAGTKLAHLFLRLELAADFTLNTQAGLASFSLKGDWALAARLPGDTGQVFPLAVQNINLSGALELDLPLINVNGFVLVPFDGVQIPVPRVSGTTPPDPVRFGEVSGDAAASWAGTKVVLAGDVLPVVTAGTLTNAETERKVHLNYDISFDESETIDLDLPLDADFQLSLVWRNKKLAVKVVRGNQVRYHNLESAFN